MALSTDFKDDILNESVNEKRKYQMTYNDDGTVSFTDVTSYSQTGSEYGAAEVNEERQAINELNSALVYTPRYDALKDGASFNKDFLSVYMPSDENRLNAPNYFSKPEEDAEWINMPASLKGKLWLGYRETQRMDGTHEMVIVTEHHPVPGRIWTNYYNNTAWTGWKSLTPQ